MAMPSIFKYCLNSVLQKLVPLSVYTSTGAPKLATQWMAKDLDISRAEMLLTAIAFAKRDVPHIIVKMGKWADEFFAA